MNDLELLKSRSSNGDRMIRAPSHHEVVGSSVDGIYQGFLLFSGFGLDLVLFRHMR